MRFLVSGTGQRPIGSCSKIVDVERQARLRIPNNREPSFEGVTRLFRENLFLISYMRFSRDS